MANCPETAKHPKPSHNHQHAWLLKLCAVECCVCFTPAFPFNSSVHQDVCVILKGRDHQSVLNRTLTLTLPLACGWSDGHLCFLWCFRCCSCAHAGILVSSSLHNSPFFPSGVGMHNKLSINCYCRINLCNRQHWLDTTLCWTCRYAKISQ